MKVLLRHPPAGVLVAVAVSTVLVAGCASVPTSTVTTPWRVSPATSPGDTLTSPLTVFAAASLTGAFTTAKTSLTAAHPGLSLTYSFAGSNALAAQITQGAPADVFASANPANMQKLTTAGLVDTAVLFARNELAIAVAAGNPRAVTGLADLARPELSVVLGAPGVPAGDYTRQVLAEQHLTVSPTSLEGDVKSALTKVTSAEADATVVYVTDLAGAGAQVTGVPIPDTQQPSITYLIAVVKATQHRPAAQAFVDSAVSGTVRTAMEAAGFLSSR